jgi:hypothetical protein
VPVDVPSQGIASICGYVNWAAHSLAPTGCMAPIPIAGQHLGDTPAASVSAHAVVPAGSFVDPHQGDFTQVPGGTITVPNGPTYDYCVPSCPVPTAPQASLHGSLDVTVTAGPQTQTQHVPLDGGL